ncbi:MAG: DUF4184 family protein [Candidatus Pristimantibacillus sp.]
MPFTLSHPLYAAPLRKVVPALSMTGLVLGSMAPDMEYFVAMQSFRSVGHSVAGFFVLGLPLCMAIAFIYHRLIVPTLPVFMPSLGGVDRFIHDLSTSKASTNKSITRISMFILSCFIGFLTHIFVDSWTHRYGWFAERIPFMQQHIGPYGVYYVLQLSLSLLGAVIPAIWLMWRWISWHRHQSRTSPKLDYSLSDKRTVWGSMFIFGTLLLLGKVIAAPDPLFLNMWVVAPFTAALFGLFVASMLFQAKQNGRLRSTVNMLVCMLILIEGSTLLRQFYGVELWSWIVYTWLLSLILAASVIVAAGQKKITALIINDVNN